MAVDSVPRKARVRRPVISCTLCRRRKIKCDHETPCGNCRRSRKGVCVYEAFPDLATPSKDTADPCESSDNLRTPSTLGSAMAYTGVPATVNASTSISDFQELSGESTSPKSEISRLRERIQQLEGSQHPAEAVRGPKWEGYQSIETVSTPRLGGTFHIFYDGENGSIPRSFAQKTRVFGQSYFAISIVQPIREVFEQVEAQMRSNKEICGSAVAAITRCKSLAREIKALRVPDGPCPLTRELPGRTIADALVQSYLQTTESVHRILHIPSFRRSYESLWQGEVDQGFLVQVKLVLALGAVTYDDNFTLRTSATRWMREAQTWMSEPRFKSRLVLHSIQTHILLMLAQDRIGIGGDPMWIASGSLIRRAMHMGLHRDPSRLPQHSIMAAEMRRRIWNTLLELNLQSSLDAGGAPMLTLEDYDTAPPANIEDEQLELEDANPQGLSNGWTASSVAIAIRHTHSQRLAIVGHLNNLLREEGYAEVLRLDKEFRAAYRTSIASLHLGAKDEAQRPEVKMLKFMMLRYLLALHAPYYNASLTDAQYAFSRTTVVDISLKLFGDFGIPMDELGSGEANRMVRRLSRCSADLFISTMHAAFHIIVELRAQIEQDSFGSLRPDLLRVLDQALPWAVGYVEAGETNVRGVQVLSLVTAQVKGLLSGLSDDELTERVIDSTKELAHTCVPLLEKQLASLQRAKEAKMQSPFGMTLDSSNQEDWDMMTFDPSFDLAGHDPLGWSMDGVDQITGLW